MESLQKKLKTRCAIKTTNDVESVISATDLQYRKYFKKYFTFVDFTHKTFSVLMT